MSDIDLTAKSALQMQYFTLNPRGDDAYALASRRAMDAYASAIAGINMALATDLRVWADRERVGVAEPAPAPEPKPVRWKLEMGLNGLVVMIPHEDRCSITYLQAGKPVALHRLQTFICIPPEGNGIEWRTGSLPFVFYAPEAVASGFIFAPDDVGQTQLWATYADVLWVGGK